MDNWQDHASCLGKDTSVWFVDDEDENNQATEAKEICALCPVLRPCLYSAIVRGERYGIWGGLNTPRRRRLRKIWIVSRRTGNWLPLERAIGEELDSLARFVSGFEDDRLADPPTVCPRCGDPIKSGRHPVDRNGANATCGIPATYNSGCRCERCIVAKAEYGRIQKARRRSRSPRGEANLRLTDTKRKDCTP